MRISFPGTCLLALVALLSSNAARAVPSYARQTGLTCAACHTAFPQLNPFGRRFKLLGYTLSEEVKPSKVLQENTMAPLSFMLQIAGTWTQKKQPDTQNGNIEFPSQMSLFYAGRISQALGAFVQITYEGSEDHFSMDNADVRGAATKTINGNKPLVYGVTVNNNPTVQDPWNSTPAWSFPFTSSSIAPAPAAATLIDGTLAQQVAGVGGYGWYYGELYGELTFYRSSQIGQPQPPNINSTGILEGTAPYWRLAYEHQWQDNAIELGTYGISASTFDSGVSGPTNDFLDNAIDMQYQKIASDHDVTLRSTFIDEQQKWASGSSKRLQTARVSASYIAQHRRGVTLGLFSTTGDRNTDLFTAADGTSRTGKPDSKGWIAELDFLPWENTKFALQYTGYTEFNGASKNYDGMGRNASDNNTLFLNAWLNY